MRKRKIYAIYACNNVQNNSDIERKIERRSFFTEQEREFTTLKKLSASGAQNLRLSAERERNKIFERTKALMPDETFWYITSLILGISFTL